MVERADKFDNGYYRGARVVIWWHACVNTESALSSTLRRDDSHTGDSQSTRL